MSQAKSQLDPNAGVDTPHHAFDGFEHRSAREESAATLSTIGADSRAFARLIKLLQRIGGRFLSGLNMRDNSSQYLGVLG
jgi:hypothetical protein